VSAASIPACTSTAFASLAPAQAELGLIEPGASPLQDFQACLMNQPALFRCEAREWGSRHLCAVFPNLLHGFFLQKGRGASAPQG